MVFSSFPVVWGKAMPVIFAFPPYNSRWSSPFTSFRSPLMPAVLQIRALQLFCQHLLGLLHLTDLWWLQRRDLGLHSCLLDITQQHEILQNL